MAVGELKWSSFYGLYYNKQNLTYLLSSTYFYLFVNTAQNRKLAADVAPVMISKNGPDARSDACTSWKLILVPRHPPECQKSIPLGAGIWCFPYITELTYSLLASRLLCSGSHLSFPLEYNILRTVGCVYVCVSNGLWHPTLLPCKVLCGSKGLVYFTITDKNSSLMQALQGNTGLWIALVSYLYERCPFYNSIRYFFKFSAVWTFWWTVSPILNSLNNNYLHC